MLLSTGRCCVTRCVQTWCVLTCRQTALGGFSTLCNRQYCRAPYAVWCIALVVARGRGVRCSAGAREGRRGARCARKLNGETRRGSRPWRLRFCWEFPRSWSPPTGSAAMQWLSGGGGETAFAIAELRLAALAPKEALGLGARSRTPRETVCSSQDPRCTAVGVDDAALSVVSGSAPVMSIRKPPCCYRSWTVPWQLTAGRTLAIVAVTSHLHHGVFSWNHLPHANLRTLRCDAAAVCQLSFEHIGH